MKTRQPCVTCGDDDHSYVMPSDILLMTELFICGHEDIESRSAEPQQFTVFDRSPTFLLNGSNRELLEVTPQLPRHVLVKKDSSHAI